ncbi:MAG TPA: hypothetical protein VGX23_14950 [Actinocrinis sp.]|nr:hypothetical protein [Actinocrinis sp.]
MYGTAEPIDAADDTGPLVEYLRCIAGEHPDWDEYRQAMVARGKTLIRITPERWLSRADRLIARSEYDLLPAAHLREKFGIDGDLPEAVLPVRDKLARLIEAAGADSAGGFQRPVEGVGGLRVVPGHVSHAGQVDEGCGIVGGPAEALGDAHGGLVDVQGASPQTLDSQDFKQPCGQVDRAVVEPVGARVGEGGVQVGKFGAQPRPGDVPARELGRVRGGGALGRGPRPAGD